MERTDSYAEAIASHVAVSVGAQDDAKKRSPSTASSPQEPVTVRIKRYVTPGREKEYQAIVEQLSREAQKFPGFLGVSVIQPENNAQDSVWNVFIKFASIEDSERWFHSDQRKHYSNVIQSQGIVDDNPTKFKVDFNRGWITRYVADNTLQLLSREDIEPVTVIVSRRILPGSEQAYQDWVVGVAKAAEAYPGNLGTSLIVPSEGDNRWVLLYRYDSLANLEAWHSSPERADMLAQLDKLKIVADPAEYEVKSGWTSFFSNPTKLARPPPKYRMIVVVFLAVWIINTLFAFQSKDGSVRSLSPAIAHGLDLSEHPERVPLTVFLTSLVAIPVLFFFVVPWMAKMAQPWLSQPVPKRPAGGWRRIVYDTVV
eukprot:TRINITY_DN11494_c4_g4_i1.p1 TRINITY_DN11494_c4_g4~~TRINITY_DN11494_c4_g4_i1.p1  ORF type:complete len:370 (+),score=73.15 TRINITY_DN11494_c4_g4_i1:79-1188(+)